MREVAWGDKPYLRKSTDRKAQIRKAFVQFSRLICALWSVDFLRYKVYHPEPPHAQSLFLFPIVFGVNLIHFFMGRTIIGLGRIWSFVSGFRSLFARLTPFERVGTQRAIFFGNGKCELIENFSAAIWWPFKKGETGSVKVETKSANFWQGKV